MNSAAPKLYLCAGTQSSGSTLISWCFLQRNDMDGILDQRGDILPNIPASMAHPFAWCKFTVNTFRLAEAMVHFQDEGWEVHPLLVLRDVRSVLNSLITKHYGCNGVTAEEPPLRMRMRRFREDWELFRANDWPMIRYESFVTKPERTLGAVCDKMGLPWDQGMVIWKKSQNQISAPIHGNATFRQTCGASLLETVNPSLASLKIDNIPPADLAWIEENFEEFNRVNDYPIHAPARRVAWAGPSDRAIPRWENTRRYRKRNRKNLFLRAVRAVPNLVASLTSMAAALWSRIRARS